MPVANILIATMLCIHTPVQGSDTRRFSDQMKSEVGTEVKEGGDSDQLAQFIWTGYRNNLEKLDRGVFKGAGDFEDIDVTWGAMRGQYTIYCAFDYRASAIRFDASKPIRVASSDNRSGAGPPWVVGERSGKFIRTSDKRISWTHGSDQVNLDHPYISNTAPVELPFDVRTLGIAYWIDIENGLTWDDMLVYASKKKIMKIVKLKDTIYKVNYTIENPQTHDISAMQSVWFAGDAGFAPVAYELRYRSGSGSQRWDNPPNEICRITWKEMSSVWLPIEYQHETYEVPGGKGRVVKKRIGLEWESVNENIDPHVFQLDGLGLPPDTMIMDVRVKPAIIVGTIGDPDKFQRSKAPQTKQERSPRAFQLLVLINCAILAVALVYIYIRNKNKPFSGSA